MCGIGGILSKGREDVKASSLVAMSEALAHRGPDDQGVYLSGNRKLGLVHRRLSIIDLSASARQPMTSVDNRYRIVHNGEIYNYNALRESLVQKGTRFKTTSDTEVILAHYAEKGEPFIDDLRGMFAFALWDEQNNNLFLARDRLGIKPLYIAETNDYFIFASEVRAILASGIIPKVLNQSGLEGYLAFGSIPSPDTMFEGIRLLRPGHFISIQNGNRQEKTYWKLSFDNQTPAIPELTSALQEAVESHLVSDVPIGLFLSGGIDSTAIAALMRKTYPGKIQSFSIVFPGTELDESRYAKLAAETFETEHHEASLTGNELVIELPKIIEAMDEPSIDGINTWFVSKMAHDYRMKVVLSGLGGDELFWGYPSYRLVPKLERLYAAVEKIPAGKALAASLLAYAPSPQLQSLGEFFQHGGTPEAGYLSVRRLFLDRERRGLCSDRTESFSPLPYLQRLSMNGQSGLSEKIAMMEFGGYMHNQLLRDTDCMAMAHGLEVRVPFLDHRLVNRVNAIAPEIKLTEQPKALLLNAVSAFIPKAIYDRPKMGFTLPYDSWLKTTLKPRFDRFFKTESYLSSKKLIDWRRARTIWTKFLHGKVHWSRPWSLFILNEWMERNLA